LDGEKVPYYPRSVYFHSLYYNCYILSIIFYRRNREYFSTVQNLLICITGNIHSFYGSFCASFSKWDYLNVYSKINRAYVIELIAFLLMATISTAILIVYYLKYVIDENDEEKTV